MQYDATSSTTITLPSPQISPTPNTKSRLMKQYVVQRTLDKHGRVLLCKDKATKSLVVLKHHARDRRSLPIDDEAAVHRAVPTNVVHVHLLRLLDSFEDCGNTWRRAQSAWRRLWSWSD
ncbi:hypothetical protein SPRG_05683 [Saprolegnia parasitica CBS 223.65]|uniref:Protein kinase domain-containing protein n=1 Tax=Saprolegnia parasitica (strain CBS 223.65) TaxID=695850 RepID=A0A067CPL2_SAPPC|nr:hypothetical protein SPRG_05683 [Saprolegnia parasitica CBS 223.65]KDO28722.1 hypothetical protein SPRG_05683 [Saprolegnia parasitica CBS 223.65]|eukprot:XP_012200362.1 hypothetical protein SPRG_05683 [Saprolegnia parasitica CBS 223.65]